MSFSIPSNINELDRLQAAQFYHDQLGWAVHPLMPPDRGDEQERGKKPMLKGWRNHRAEEVTQDFIRRHFNGTSHTNVGCVVRPPFIHVDLDSKPDAGESVRSWLATKPELDHAPRERTGGGAHLSFICRDLPESVLKSKKAITCQINDKVSAELYFDGLNIVLSPSVHKSGHRYVWEITGPIPEVSWEQLCHWFGFETPEAAKRGRPKKDSAWWSAFNGDLATLDIVALFRRAGRLGDCIDPDSSKWAVRCPWDHDHSKQHDGIGTDTAIFASEPPGFKCLHAHCAERSIKDVVEWFDAQQSGIVDEHCREQRVWKDGQKDREGRPRIVLPGPDREDSEFATEVAEVIAPKEVWFNKAERVVSVRLLRFSEKAQSLGFQALEPIEARTAIEDHVQTGLVQMDRDTSQPVFSARTMTRECAAGLLAAPQLRRKLPEIIRILDFPLPIRLPGGEIAQPKSGYDPRFRIYTDPAAPELRRMSRDEAFEWIRQAHVGFGFRDKQSLVHAIARLITPYCRGLMGWDGRFPLWHFSGNRPRAGKDYLAGVTQIVYEGRSIEDAPLERESEETRKRITAALMSGRRMLHFANCQGHIQDAVFIGAITSKTFGARNLGSTDARSDLTLPNEIEFSISANIGLTFRPDVEPRTRRITLEFPEDNANGREFPNPELHDWVRQHRREILSAIDSLVAMWVEAGCPAGKRPFNSFPEWATVVGGVLGFHNLGDPCEPHLDDGGLPADRQTEAMRMLFVIGYAAHPDKWVGKAQIYEIIESNAETEAFSWFGDLAEKGVKHRIGKDLRQFKDRELDGILLQIDDHADKSQQHRFQFTKRKSNRGNVLNDLFTGLSTVQDAAATDPTTPNHGHLGRFGHSIALPKLQRFKLEENNKKREYIEGYSTGTGEEMPETPAMPVGRFITVGSELPAIAAAIRESRSVALDLETYGSRKGDGLDPWAGDIRLLSLCVEGQEPWILDLRAIGYDLSELKTALESIEIIAHNAKFDLLWLRVKCGLRATRVFCTLVAARLLSAGTKPGNDLDKCLERYLGIAPAPDHSRSDWGSMFLTEDQLAYAARDVLHLQALSNKLWGLLESDQLDVVGRLEFDLVPVIVEMEAAGIAVDKARLREIETRARSSASDHAGMLRQKLNLPKLNPGSPQQLLEALKAAGIELENTNEETLKAADDGEIIPLILDYRGAEKLAQQATSLLECVKQDGRIHGRFDPTGTATGRFSSKDPNLQNVGRGELRTCFVPEPGNKLIVADYSQIELRAAAVIAGEKKMIEAYKNGVDLHKQTASEVLGKPLDEVTKQDRQTSKACFSGDTEVLTPKGWVRFDQYDGRAEVAQYVLPEGVVWNPPRPRSNRWGHPTGKVHWDAGRGIIEFVIPLGFQSFEDRELFQHEDRNTDLLVTADHQIAFISNSGDARKVAAAEVTTGNCRHFIAAGHLQGCTQPNTRLELFTRSLAMVIADGYFSSARCVRFGFSKQRKVERCLKLLSALGFHPKVSTSGRVTSISVADEAWVDAMRAWTQGGKDLSWSCLHQLPARIYLEEAANWDSHVILGAQRDRALFCTTSKQTAEVMQAMAALSGIPSQLSYSPKTNPKHRPTYRLSYVLRGPSTWRASWNLKPTGRRERVWCVQVPSGAILIRRNGKVCVQGNCNFGLLYGQSAPGLVRYAASSYGVQMELDQAEQIRRQFFRTYDRLRQWHGVSHNQADAGAREVRTVLGRRRLIPETASEWERFTALVNTPVQGGCADGMKQALVLLAQRLPSEARLISTVHDEVLVEAPEAMANEVCDLVQATMIEAMAALFPQVPIEVEAGSCSNWGEK